MRNARRSVMTALLTAGLATTGCATLLGLPDENGDALGQGTPSDDASDKDVSVLDTADSGEEVSTVPNDAGTADADAAPDSGPSILKLMTGVYHQCVIREDGDGGTRTDCWGDNGVGALGRGNTEGLGAPGPVVEPMTSLPFRTLVDIQGGEGFTCAIDTAKDVYCWGLNSVGQLGIGTPLNDKARPTQVPGVSNIEKLSAGQSTVLALGANGVTSWWGESMLDPGANYEAVIIQPAPTTAGLDPWSQLASSNGHACLLKTDGDVLCWGRNDSLQSTAVQSACDTCSQLADGGGLSEVCNRTPTKVAGLPIDANELRAGYSATCILASSNIVWCWGNSDNGQLGDRGNDIVKVCGRNGMVAGMVPDGVGFKAIAVGYEQVCGVKITDGSVWCWGSSGYSTLGNGAGASSNVPVQVIESVSNLPLTGMDLVSARSAATCAARKSPAAVYCWGENNGNYKWMMGGANDDLPKATLIELPAL